MINKEVNDKTNLLADQNIDHDHDNATENQTDDVSINNCGYMSYFWIFVASQCTFGMLKYGPFSIDDCTIMDKEFNPESCESWPLFIVQFSMYFILLILVSFCTCGQSESIISELCKRRCCSCDHLIFPFSILILMTISQLFIALSHQSWYFWQLGIDLFGYSLWLLFAPIFSSVLKKKFEIETDSLFMIHIVFIAIAFFSIIWLLVAMFGEDFTFDKFNDQPFAKFVQIILEGTLILEWLHIVLHDCVHPHVHSEKKEANKKDHINQTTDDVRELLAGSDSINAQNIEEESEDDEDGNDDEESEEQDDEESEEKNSIKLDGNDEIVQPPKEEPKDPPDQAEEVELKKENEQRGAVVGNCWFLFVFALDIVAVLVFGIWKIVINEHCSSYDLHIGGKCPHYLWILEGGFLSFALLVLYLIFVTHREYIKMMQFHRLLFPIIVWIILMVIEIIYIFAVNKWYILQFWIDLTGYIIFFTQALYAVQLRKYIKALSKENNEGVCETWNKLQHQSHKNENFKSTSCGACVCNIHLAIVTIICILDALLCLTVIILNCYKDVNAVEDAAENVSAEKSVVEIIAFIQIIFENALLIEYIHVLLGGWTVPCYCN